MIAGQIVGLWRSWISVAFLGLFVVSATFAGDEAAKAGNRRRIQSLAEALEFAQTAGRIPAGLKLEAIKVLRTSAENQFSLTFRDGAQSHNITIRAHGDFKTQTRRGPTDKPGFWESAPSPRAVVAATDERIEMAKAEGQKAGGEPGDVVMAEYRAGYRQSDAFIGQWTIHVGLRDEAPKSTVKAKTVIFADSRLTKLADGELQLYRRPF
jgi:hypothetical protein